MQSDGDRNMDMVKKRAWLKGRRRVERVGCTVAQKASQMANDYAFL